MIKKHCLSPSKNYTILKIVQITNTWRYKKRSNGNNQNTIITVKTIAIQIIPGPQLNIQSGVKQIIKTNDLYTENYNPSSETDTFVIKLSSIQINSQSAKELSRSIWQQLVYAVDSASPQLANKFASPSDHQTNLQIDKPRNDYINSVINSFSDNIIVIDKI